ncbi:cytochrome P450 [Streptomyces sp. ADMS]|uniref:cytochrome P450 n=1 Tax=Streptomyces sp. ADMS TaxID=3071415 RepID=UPI00296FE1AB|nr:cytochrome P450 [Streptomyces sp. ADMS]MDW4909134.1 cytochrome P450 [Streptomyces sp. ADMS]
MTNRQPARCPYRDENRQAADPCTDYLPLRGAEPIRWDEDLEVWIVSGFREMTTLLRHPALSAAWPQRGGTTLHHAADDEGRASEVVRRWFMFNDDPGHAAARRLVAPLFTADRLAELRPFVEKLVDELLDAKPDGLDVMADLAVPLSSRVICQLLGLPETVAPRLHDWAPDIAALLIADYLPEVRARGHRALGEIVEVVEETLRSEVPTGSGLWLLRSARLDGAIEAADIWATASLLIYAGFETTSTFIGKAVRSALHAGAWLGVQHGEPATVVDELLRFDTSVQQVARVATAPVEVAGHRIAAGDLVLLMLGVANRDPDVFTDPDLLDYDREIRRHLTFGYGAHYCLGAALARLETEVALEGLGSRWTGVVLSEPPVTRQHYGITVLEHLALRGAAS